MDTILDQFTGLFDGIGEIKLPPIEIYMKKGPRPKAQKQRTIPIHLMEPLREKLEEFLKAGIIEGPLKSEHAKGWVHNVVLTEKEYDKTIRLNSRHQNHGEIRGCNTIPHPHLRAAEAPVLGQ